MLDFSAGVWVIVCLSAFFIGLNKTCMPGIGIVVIPVLAYVMDAKESTGFLLPMLIVGDIFAVTYYRRHALWRHLVKLLPCAVVGVLIGYFLLRDIRSEQLKPVIGWIIVGLMALDYWRTHRAGAEAKVPTHWSFAVSIGIAAGAVTMMANAAGPLMVIYLLAMRLDKHEFLGTGAWYFLIINILKVPFSAQIGLITPTSLLTNLALAPLIGAGALCGVYVFKRIPQKSFSVAVRLLALAAALKLASGIWL